MTDNLESDLRALKLLHLTEVELAAYVDGRLVGIELDRAEAHLKGCFSCQRQVELLREEMEA